MTNTIERKDYPSLFESVGELITTTSYSEHRRGSTFFTKSIVEISPDYKEGFPDVQNFDELIGEWETNQYVRSDEDVDYRDITKLIRVKLVEVEKVVKSKEWQPVQ